MHATAAKAGAATTAPPTSPAWSIALNGQCGSEVTVTKRHVNNAQISFKFFIL